MDRVWEAGGRIYFTYYLTAAKTIDYVMANTHSSAAGEESWPRGVAVFFDMIRLRNAHKILSPAF